MDQNERSCTGRIRLPGAVRQDFRAVSRIEEAGSAQPAEACSAARQQERSYRLRMRVRQERVRNKCWECRLQD